MLSSGLLKQINDLKNSIKESINYFDVNYKGIDEKGGIGIYGIAAVFYCRNIIFDIQNPSRRCNTHLIHSRYFIIILFASVTGFISDAFHKNDLILSSFSSYRSSAEAVLSL